MPRAIFAERQKYRPSMEFEAWLRGAFFETLGGSRLFGAATEVPRGLP